MTFEMPEENDITICNLFIKLVIRPMIDKTERLKKQINEY